MEFIKLSSMYCGRLRCADDKNLEGSKRLASYANLINEVIDQINHKH